MSSGCARFPGGPHRRTCPFGTSSHARNSAPSPCRTVLVAHSNKQKCMQGRSCARDAPQHQILTQSRKTNESGRGHSRTFARRPGMVWAAADHVEPRHRRRGDATHRRTDDWRNGVVGLLTLIVIPAIYAGVKGRASIASPGASGHCRHERVTHLRINSATATESCNGRTVRRARTFVPAATALALAGQGLTSARSCPGRPAGRPTCASGSRGRRGRVRSKGRRAWRRK
jgi:hypothetical protein